MCTRKPYQSTKFAHHFILRMKRSVKSIIKFILIVFGTVITTFITFHSLRQPRYLEDYDKSRVIMPLPPQETHSLKIDWHNYTLIEEENKRQGNGEHGKAASLPPHFSHEKKEMLYKVNGFNGLLSDYIALNRSVPDIRHPECKKKKYLAKLPSVSVIVPFHNEHLSTLLRTAISVINRTPPKLLREIVLVDDFSTKVECKKELDDYISAHLPKVKVVRLPKRKGLIRARLAGAKEATAPVLVFLDSHTEANVNWLPPLLEPIAENERTCVCPFIDVIAYEDFTYRAQDEGARGAFDWEFFYKRLPLLPQDLANPTKPFRSPVMAGGLFAISAKFFWELGGYDPGLDIWGGEQYELSFKIWLCGGLLLDAPCSRVGHIYRKFAPFPNPGVGDFVGRNYRRVATVWMDEYAEYLYSRRPQYRSINPGDLSKQFEIKNRLKCKSFRWFMEEIAFDLVKKYPPIEPPDFAHGEIRNAVATELCVDTQHKGSDETFGLKECIKGHKGVSGEQEFLLTWHKDIRPKGRNMCWDVSSSIPKAPVQLYNCHGSQGNQLWKYDTNKKWLIHGGNPRCLDADLSRKTIFVTKCDPESETQKWLIEDVDYKALASWDHVN